MYTYVFEVTFRPNGAADYDRVELVKAVDSCQAKNFLWRTYPNAFIVSVKKVS